MTIGNNPELAILWRDWPLAPSETVIDFFIEVCACGCGLRAHVEMAAGARFERRVAAAAFFLLTR
jgi:hypothetical protein